jgi:hypothetical protein
MRRIQLSVLNKYSIYLFITGLALYSLVFLINGENNVFEISDNLDSEILFRKLPKEAGVLFSISNDAMVPQIMNGLKRNSLNASAFNIETVLFYLFSPIYAYILNLIIISIVGFTGIYLLSSKYILKNIKDQNKILSGLLAFAFILVPTYTIYGLAIIGFPLLIYCILNILNKKNQFLSYLFIGIYPFYSSLVLGGFAVILLIFLSGLYYLFLNKKKSRGFVLIRIAILITCLFFISEINLINQFFFDTEFISQRTTWPVTLDSLGDFSTADNIEISAAFYRSLGFFFKDYEFKNTYHQLIILFLIILSLLTFKQLIQNKYIVLLVLFLVAASFIHGFIYSNLLPLVWLKEKIILFRIFKIDRISWLNCAVWYILFAFLIRIAFKQKKKSLIILTYLLLITNLGLVFFKGEFNTALILIFKKEHSMTSWEKFYSKNLFNQIKRDINKPLDSFRTVNIGVYPAVTQYNGFYTLDSYQNNYSLEYKKQFRKIISRELEKSERMKSIYDNWGSKCFVFVAELDKYGGMLMQNDLVIQKLELNTDVLYNMGGRYVISSVEIGNYQENNLKFFNKYSNEVSPYTIYLYEVLTPLDSILQYPISVNDTASSRYKLRPLSP